MSLRAVLAAGLLVRLVVLALSDGFGYDLQGFTAAERAFREFGLHAYEQTNDLWPYPPAYFPWLVAAAEIGGFARTLRLPAIAADLVLAWLVASLLARRGAARTTQVGAVAVVMFAPIFVAHSSHHGQLDSVATAFGLAALWVWTRPGTPRRALVAGLLLGVGGAVKTVPLLLVLALSPSARSWRERLQLAGAAGAVWLLAVLPFTLAAPEATREALSYRGVPGYGGLSLVLLKLGADDAFLYLYEHSQSLLLAPALLVATVVMHRRRAEPLTAALVVWLVVYVFGFNFFQHYLIWALPVLLALGRVPVAAVVAAATAAPLTTVYFSEDVPVWAIETFYTAPMIAVWLAAIYGLTRAARPAPARSGTAT